MSTLLHANAARITADQGLPPDVNTFQPLDVTPTASEINSVIFPSEAGGVGYLFGHNILDAVPTPIEEVPYNRPDPAANAMGAVLEEQGASVYSSHVGTPDNTIPVTPEFDIASEAVPPNGVVVAPAQGSSSGVPEVLKQEWTRLKGMFTIEKGTRA